MVCFDSDLLRNWATGLSQSIGLASLSFSKPTLSDIEHAEANGNRFGFSWHWVATTIKCAYHGLWYAYARLGFNHRWVEATQSAPPLPASAFPGHKAGFNFTLPRWQVDHKRKQVERDQHTA